MTRHTDIRTRDHHRDCDCIDADMVERNEYEVASSQRLKGPPVTVVTREKYIER
jgi:hypothetical protein